MSQNEKAYFALACFWKPDAQFGCCKGVTRTRVGYAGGTGPAPNYPSVGDHTETIEVEYDPNTISYEELLKLFWKFHNPCSCQKRQYKSAIFYTSELQKALALKSKEHYEKDNEANVTTDVLPLNVFHEAEEYHQKYFLRTYHRSFYYKLSPEDPVTSLRDARLNGFLSGHGSIQDLEDEKENLGLTEEQFLYVKKHVTKELKPPTIEPFLRTVVQVGWNYVKKATGF